MKISLKPQIREFTLEADPDGVAVIGVRPATEDDNIEIAAISKTTERVLRQGEDELIIRSDFNRREANRKEAYRVLAYVKGFTDDDGNELFRSAETPNGPRVSAGMSETQFNAAWGLIPDSKIVFEIMKHIYEVNPEWTW